MGHPQHKHHPALLAQPDEQCPTASPNNGFERLPLYLWGHTPPSFVMRKEMSSG